MNRYETYKDSGISWLGEVPDHWEVKRLKFLARIQNGADYKHVETNDGYPVIGSGGQFAYANSYLYDGESVLLGRKGTIDKPLYVNGKFWTVDTMYYTEILKNTYPKYLYYLTLTIDFGRYSTQTALPSMTQTALNNLVFAVPHYKEQTAIAHYLDAKLGEIDALIGKQQTLLEKLAEQRTAVITHAVTKGLNPAAAMKNSGVEWLGDVPAHWDVSPFKLVMNSIIDYRGKTPEKTNSGVFLITARNIKNGIIDYTLSQEFIDEDNYEEVMRRGLPKLGQVLMTTEAPLGEVAQIDRIDVALAQRVLKFDGKKDKLDNRFLKYFILSKAFQASLYKFATGSTALGIKSERLSYLKSLLPPVTEQSAIANYLDQETAKIDRLCDTVNQTIGRLKEYRTALITQAVTGKIKVTDE